MWGGHKPTKLESKGAEKKIDIYNPCQGQWSQATTFGDIPASVNEGACVASRSFLYTYGGNCGLSKRSGSLHQLDSNSLTWKLLSQHVAGGPMKKSGCGMLAYENEIIVFGGHGAPGSIKRGSQFVQDSLSTGGHYGKTNELHAYDLIKSKKW